MTCEAVWRRMSTASGSSPLSVTMARVSPSCSGAATSTSRVTSGSAAAVTRPAMAAFASRGPIAAAASRTVAPSSSSRGEPSGRVTCRVMRGRSFPACAPAHLAGAVDRGSLADESPGGACVPSPARARSARRPAEDEHHLGHGPAEGAGPGSRRPRGPASAGVERGRPADGAVRWTRPSLPDPVHARRRASPTRRLQFVRRRRDAGSRLRRGPRRPGRCGRAG